MSGLKFSGRFIDFIHFEAHPAWDEWIEIPLVSYFILISMAHPAWDEWIEITEA